MRLFEVTYTDGRVEQIEAAGCWPNDWAVSFVHEEQRPSKAFNAKPGDTVVKYHSFRVIAGRLISEVREIGSDT